MTWLFSKRCKEALLEKKLKVSIPLPVRIRIWSLLKRCDEEHWETDAGYHYQVNTLENLPGKIKAELGCDLLAFPKEGGSPKPADLEEFVLRGSYPPYLFDTLELFYLSISPDRQHEFQSELNVIMEENDLPWRMANGKVFPVESAYIEENIIRKSYYLLREAKFDGALLEFEKARTDLSAGDHAQAIQNANLAVESVIKGIFDIKKAKPGQLFRKLIDSEIIPEYYDGFLNAFENILRSVAIMRNEEQGAGHGSGAEKPKIPYPLAELAVNLSAVLINFLIKYYLESLDRGSSEESLPGDDDIPF